MPKARRVWALVVAAALWSCSDDTTSKHDAAPTPDVHAADSRAMDVRDNDAPRKDGPSTPSCTFVGDPKLLAFGSDGLRLNGATARGERVALLWRDYPAPHQEVAFYDQQGQKLTGPFVLPEVDQGHFSVPMVFEAGGGEDVYVMTGGQRLLVKGASGVVDEKTIIDGLIQGADLCAGCVVMVGQRWFGSEMQILVDTAAPPYVVATVPALALGPSIDDGAALLNRASTATIYFMRDFSLYRAVYENIAGAPGTVNVAPVDELLESPVTAHPTAVIAVETQTSGEGDLVLYSQAGRAMAALISKDGELVAKSQGLGGDEAATLMTTDDDPPRGFSAVDLSSGSLGSFAITWVQSQKKGPGLSLSRLHFTILREREGSLAIDHEVLDLTHVSDAYQNGTRTQLIETEEGFGVFFDGIRFENPAENAIYYQAISCP